MVLSLPRPFRRPAAGLSHRPTDQSTPLTSNTPSKDQSRCNESVLHGGGASHLTSWTNRVQGAQVDQDPPRQTQRMGDVLWCRGDGHIVQSDVSRGPTPGPDVLSQSAADVVDFLSLHILIRVTSFRAGLNGGGVYDIRPMSSFVQGSP